MPKTPITTAPSGSPVINWEAPKVKRCSCELGSMPTVPMNRPRPSIVAACAVRPW